MSVFISSTYRAGRGVEDAVQIGGVGEAAGVAQNPRFGEVSAPRLDAVRRGVVDQDQPHPQPLARGRHRRQQPRHQLALVRVDHADVEVGRGHEGMRDQR